MDGRKLPVNYEKNYPHFEVTDSDDVIDCKLCHTSVTTANENAARRILKPRFDI